jgi:hypothetical protein
LAGRPATAMSSQHAAPHTQRLRWLYIALTLWSFGLDGDEARDHQPAAQHCACVATVAGWGSVQSVARLPLGQGRAGHHSSIHHRRTQGVGRVAQATESLLAWASVLPKSSQRSVQRAHFRVGSGFSTACPACLGSDTIAAVAKAHDARHRARWLFRLSGDMDDRIYRLRAPFHYQGSVCEQTFIDCSEPSEARL